MTKKELIEAMKDYPDDVRVVADCWFNTRDPAGHYAIIGVYEFDNTIALKVDEDGGSE